MIVFLTTEATNLAFKNAMTAPLLGTLCASAALLVPKIRADIGIGFSLLISCLTLAIALGVTYWLTFGFFTAAQVTRQEIRLHFTGPFPKTIVLPRDAIAEVLHAGPESGEGKCSVTIVTKPGKRYHSATVQRSRNACAALGYHILGTLGIAPR